MSSCNGLSHKWAISPMITVGCRLETSCNGAVTGSGALQEIIEDSEGWAGKTSCNASELGGGCSPVGPRRL